MKKRGVSPKYDHAKIKEMLLENKRPIAIILALGCSYSVVRYVRNKVKKKPKT